MQRHSHAGDLDSLGTVLTGRTVPHGMILCVFSAMLFVLAITPIQCVVIDLGGIPQLQKLTCSKRNRTTQLSCVQIVLFVLLFKVRCNVNSCFFAKGIIRAYKLL